MQSFLHLPLMLLFLNLMTPPGPSDDVEAEILIRNIKDTKGVFVISLYNSDKAFPKIGKELLIEKVTVHDTLPHLVKITLPAEGWYAIAMFQDQDENGKIKQDKVGIPEEPYAFSNNIHPRVEAPGFSSCKIYVGKGENKPQEIRLIQPRFHSKL
jgi:uncharacterized protein (DUF2141 family)